MTSKKSKPSLIPFIDFLKENRISKTSGYRLVKEGVLRITKIRRRSYLTGSEIERFFANLEKRI